MDVWVALVILAIIMDLGVICMAVYSLWGLQRLSRQSMDAVGWMQGNQTSIISELIAHRTLAETGNQIIAGQMLAHSNAHDARNEPPLHMVTMPPQQPEPMQGPHESPEIVFGEEDMIPPLPGQE